MVPDGLKQIGPYGGGPIYCLVSGANILAGVGNGVYHSTNNGTSWTLDTAGMGDQYVYSLAVSGANIFAGTYNHGVYLSTNNGTSWTAEILDCTHMFCPLR